MAVTLPAESLPDSPPELPHFPATDPGEPAPEAAAESRLDAHAEAYLDAHLDAHPDSHLDAHPEETPLGRGMSSPAALAAVVAVGALVLIGCVLGATLTGVFGNLSSSSDATPTPAPTWIDPSREAVATFGDGQWLVTRDIRAGTYETTVPAGSPGCTWERNASTDGTASSVLDSGAGAVAVKIVVTIKETDAVFQSQGCGNWHRIGA